MTDNLDIDIDNYEIKNTKKEDLIKEVEDYEEKNKIKGVCYITRLPPKFLAKDIYHYFSNYEVERLYLKPKKSKVTNIKKGRDYTSGWVEFSNKRVAKLVAQTFNNQRIGNKKGSKLYDNFWNIKYLPKFKWDYINERNQNNKVNKQEKILHDIRQIKKKQEFIIGNLLKSNNLKEKKESNKIEEDNN